MFVGSSFKYTAAAEWTKLTVSLMLIFHSWKHLRHNFQSKTCLVFNSSCLCLVMNRLWFTENQLGYFVAAMQTCIHWRLVLQWFYIVDRPYWHLVHAQLLYMTTCQLPPAILLKQTVNSCRHWMTLFLSHKRVHHCVLLKTITPYLNSLFAKFKRVLDL